MRFDDIKSVTLNLRVSPSFKEALRVAADHDQRSMVNMLEVLVGRHCEKHRLSIAMATPRAARAATKIHARSAAT